jgi:hypothetical protein
MRCEDDKNSVRKKRIKVELLFELLYKQIGG